MTTREEHQIDEMRERLIKSAEKLCSLGVSQQVASEITGIPRQTIYSRCKKATVNPEIKVRQETLAEDLAKFDDVEGLKTKLVTIHDILATLTDSATIQSCVAIKARLANIQVPNDLFFFEINEINEIENMGGDNQK